ncbi:acyltransferase [Pseudarthrobacter sp. O4]|uniref:acyltransferase n=1 Tax=Pseudarthrobacter sp. O4 TaxID=3418417 RepID=UPI003CF1F950
MTITALAPYRDDKGNTIIYSGTGGRDVTVEFRGSNNTLEVAETANLRKVHFSFDCDNGVARIGGHKTGNFAAFIRIGQDSTVTIGDDVTATQSVSMTCVEGQTLTIGNDCMFAVGCQVRTDDAHAIFDVRSGERVNPSKPVVVGNHVWLSNGSVLLGGATVGDGSVIGVGSLVKGRIPNNCIAVGAPAKVVRMHTAWERPHLSLSKPYYKPDASTVKKSAYWNMTVMAPEYPSFKYPDYSNAAR